MTPIKEFPRFHAAAALITSTAALFSFNISAPATAASITPIAEIQGTGPVSPLVNQSVTTRGVVTAVYTEGGLQGYYIQTEGTGASGRTPGASDGLFIYSPATVGSVSIGDFIEVTGKVSEHYGQTQLSVAGASDLTVLAVPYTAVTAVDGQIPETEEGREALEGMLLRPSAHMTVTDNYNTNRYGEIGLVNGSEPLKTATDVVAPGADALAYEAANAAKVVILDDGATVDYTRAGTGTPLPYISTSNPLRVGSSVTFQRPVVLGYSFEAWRLQPTQPVTGATDPAALPASWSNTRTQAPAVTGEQSISSFNVLNYFTTVGDTVSGCKFYTDREKNPITVSGSCSVRGAATLASFERQQSKIVAAINKIDTSVLSLEEIENTLSTGHQDRDIALNKLVDELNKDAGYTKWAAVKSPSILPATEDVIRTAFIYQPAEVKPVGESVILDHQAFSNARQPLAQAFAPADSDATSGDSIFVAVVNHFKSKGSGSGENADQGDGQGASVASRVAQAQALVAFANQQAKDQQTENVILLGDFNSYTQEDPLKVLYDAGYTNLGEKYDAGSTYLFGGRVGSLDHILASPALTEKIESAQVWNINSVESIALEYSRYNYNITNFFEPNEFRSSDHDPLLVGMNLAEEPIVFSDVKEGDPFYTEIMWLARQGITAGWEDGTYRPLENIERGAMAAFFYRLASSPAFEAPKTPSFSDVPTSHPFYQEIEWMKAQGITTGWEDGTYRPHLPVNRDAMAAFFYRYAGQPEYTPPASGQFSDVTSDTKFYREIMWLSSRGITTGWQDGTYRPVQPIKRDAMAAFIYRYSHAQ